METDADLAEERRACEAIAAVWSWWPDLDVLPPDLDVADVLVVNSKRRVGPEVMARMAGRCVLTTTSGFDHLDLLAAARAGVVVGRAPEARRDAVVEVTVGGLVWGMRRLGDLQAMARDGRWARSALPGMAPRGLSGAVIAVVGLGVIGARVAETLFAMGSVVRGVDPYAAHPLGGWALADALDGADAVTLHCALSPSSRRLLDAASLDGLAPHAVVVNTARGDVLDVEEAVRRVQDGRLAGLVCDVFPEEPYPGLAAAAHPQILFTPHGAGFTHDLGRRVARAVVDAAARWSTSRTVPYPVALPSAS